MSVFEFYSFEMGLWNKVKGVFSRIGSGIKNFATKTYDWLTNNKDKIKNAANTLNEQFGGKYKDNISNYIDKGSNLADKTTNILSKGLSIIK